jgi:hypothetical protein
MPASMRPTTGSSSLATTMARQRVADASAHAGSTRASSAGTSGRPRAASGCGTPSRRAIVAASSSTERGSRETVPGSAPSPQTTNGTGRSPQSR